MTAILGIHPMLKAIVLVGADHLCMTLTALAVARLPVPHREVTQLPGDAGAQLDEARLHVARVVATRAADQGRALWGSDKVAVGHAL